MVDVEWLVARVRLIQGCDAVSGGDVACSS